MGDHNYINNWPDHSKLLLPATHLERKRKRGKRSKRQERREGKKGSGGRTEVIENWKKDETEIQSASWDLIKSYRSATKRT